MNDAARDDGMNQELHARVLDERLDRALAASPEPAVPEEFLTRVMAALPEEGAPASSRYGRAVLLVCGGLLALVLVLLLPGVQHLPRWLVSLLSLELAVVALSAGSWRRVLRWPA